MFLPSTSKLAKINKLENRKNNAKFLVLSGLPLSFYLGNSSVEILIYQELKSCEELLVKKAYFKNLIGWTAKKLSVLTGKAFKG